MKEAHPQNNTLLKAAKANAATKAFKRVFFSPPQDKIELKKISFPSENKKYPTTQSNTTQMTVKLNRNNGLRERIDRTPAGNKVLPKAGVTNFYEIFVLYSTLIFQINSSAETPRLRQYPKRYRMQIVLLCTLQ